MNEAADFYTDGEAYERLMGRWSRLVGEKFLDWIDIPRGLRWLDVGCGNGAFTEELIARCAPSKAMAVDSSDDQLVYARQRPGAEMAEFRVADAQALPFSSDSFDVGVMALVISLLSDPRKAVAELARVVRPAGCVATYMWDMTGGGLPHEPVYIAMNSLGVIRTNPPSISASRRDNMREIWE